MAMVKTGSPEKVEVDIESEEVEEGVEDEDGAEEAG